MDVKIYVATHRKYKHLDLLTDPIYIPILCGKAIYNPNEDFCEGTIPEFGDDTGDNISARNRNYCELTALYWIWKNDKSYPDDIVGLNHYRRYFGMPDNNLKFIDKKSIIDFLSRYHFIVNGSGSEYDEEVKDPEKDSVYAGYGDCHIIQDLDNALIGVKKLFPALYPRIEREIKRTDSMALCNMMICKKRFLDRYCNFLFPVLKYVDSTIDFNDDDHQDYNGRVFGFLGERLFRPWIMATGYTAVNGPYIDWENLSGDKGDD